MKTFITIFLLLLCSSLQAQDLNQIIINHNKTIKMKAGRLTTGTCDKCGATDKQLLVFELNGKDVKYCEYCYDVPLMSDAQSPAADSTTTNPMHPSSTLLFKLWALIQQGTPISQVTDTDVLEWYRLMEEHR